ncbi:hypothetical protein [Oribacterium sinus]|uniref:hypothetical protein n=2 Tax=Oribacterium sinus TaxID=237576 RepID=UPI0028EEDCF3|nr:hypothetical protein [Oribacterium sinus]
MEQQDEQKEKLQQEGDSGDAGSTASDNLQAAAEAVEEKLEEGKEELKNQAENLATEAQGKVEQLAEGVQDQAENLVSEAQDKLNELAPEAEKQAEAAESKAEAAESKAEEAVQEAQAHAEEAAEKVQDKATELAKEAEAKAEEAAQEAGAKAEEVVAKAETVAAAAGAAVAEKASELKEKAETETDKKIKEIKAKKQVKDNANAENAGKNNSALFVGVAVVLILLVLASFFALLPRKTKVNLDKYVTVSFDGYDGYGKALVKFDKDAYLKDYKKKIKLKKSGNFLQDSLTKNYGAAELLYDFYVDGNWKIEGDSSDGKLKNGETVKLSWGFNQEELEEQFKVKFSSKGTEFKVEGLKDVQLFDAFKDFDYKFTGISPEGAVEWKGTGDMDGSKGYYFTVEPSMDLKNGDKVKVKIEPANPESVIQKYGIAPKETEKEITVEGLPSYVEKADAISDSLLQDMQKEITDKIQSQLASQGEEVSFVGAEYLGYYFLTSKSANAFEHNIMFPVMKVNVQINIPDKSYNAQHSYYFTGAFTNLMDEGSGKVTVDLNDMDIPYHYATIDTGVVAWFSTVKFNFSGFEDLNSLRNQCVSQKLDKYTVEETVKDPAAQSTESGAENKEESSSANEEKESSSAAESSAANPS